MIRWTGLAPREFDFPFPGSLTSTFLSTQEEELEDAIRHGGHFERVAEVDSRCRFLIVPLFRGSSRFESLILAHYSRFSVTRECNKEGINGDDYDAGGGARGRDQARGPLRHRHGRAGRPGTPPRTIITLVGAILEFLACSKDPF